ncbi:MAG: bifunctional oligoribonuclease/PAP phosphatase NrnA [Ruminococcaceae bacterium]|nr:bifunctional oligoribonuclease/PAP phosphatase NrnA [Oscillospiraceae bacterium]
MSEQKIRLILDKIKEYDRIVIFRHRRPDGDAVGSTKGLREILRISFPKKDIRLINCDYSDYVAFLGDEDEAQPDDFYRSALAIVLDTATAERISNPKYELCREIIKIDHHIVTQPYGDICWIEEERSSTCEMIVKFYDVLKRELEINKEAATYLFTGMVTDSGRFRYRDVSGETLRLAGCLLDLGVDTDIVYANLYMDPFDELKFKSHMLKKIKLTANGVAYMYIDRATQEKFGMSFEQASACVSYMDSIRDSLIWIAFVECADGSIRVRLRSRFVTVSPLAEKYNGGGHACAAGATVYSSAEMKKLLREADLRLREYKENNEGWL